MTPRVSLVIPLYNEAGNVLPLVERAHQVLHDDGGTFEIILVDDGSRDATAREIAAAVDRFPGCRAITLPDNRGQATALLTGLRAATGELLATMDGDGQNDPRDLPGLLALVDNHTYDIVCGWRRDRHDSPLRRVMSRVANSVRRRFLADGIHDAGCQLRVFRREVREVLFPCELLQSFIPAIAHARGFRLGEIPVRHHPRSIGESKYGFRRLWLKPAIAMWRLRRQLRESGPR